MADYLKTLGSNIRRFRKLSDKTQEDVANTANLNASYYGRVERGEINLTVSTLVAISRALNVDLKELFNTPVVTTDRKRLQAEVSKLVNRLDFQALQTIRDLFAQLPKVK